MYNVCRYIGSPIGSLQKPEVVVFIIGPVVFHKTITKTALKNMVAICPNLKKQSWRNERRAVVV